LDNVSFQQLQDASKHTNQQKACLCGNLEAFTKHFHSMVTGMKHATACAVCGIPASAQCGICKVALHPPASNRATKNNPPKNSNCFVDYHNTMFFGLAKCDCKLIIDGDSLSKRKANYQYPNSRKKNTKIYTSKGSCSKEKEQNKKEQMCRRSSNGIKAFTCSAMVAIR
jgi:hypothetical protein